MAAEPDATRRVVAAVLADLRNGGGDRPIVACSGGPDSLALARATALVAGSRDVRPIVVIIDHGLQRDSAAVAQRAAGACRSMGLEQVHVRRVRVQSRTDGPEAAARRSRRAELEAMATGLGASCVLLGHTRDDQAESVLLGLARGSGTRSLAGMAAVSGIYRRPLLALSRATVARAGDSWGLHPWSDPHNRDVRFTRSRVRSTVLPVLERELGPGIAAGLARAADLARADADALDELADQEYRARRAAALQVAGLAELPDAISSRVVRRWLLDRGVPAGALSATHIREVARLCTDWHGQGPLCLPGGTSVERDCGTLVARSQGTGMGRGTAPPEMA